MAEMPLLIILAGGASSRMWPLREKSLIRFGSEPLLLRQLRRFADLGLREAVIVANPDSEQDIRALAHSIGEISTTVAVQTNPKGMGDALLQAAGCIDADRPIYVVQVHDVVDDQLHRDILAAFAANPTSTYLAGYEREDYFPGGYLIVTGDGRITGIVEKPGAENRPSNLVNIVAHIHSSATDLFDKVRDTVGRAAKERGYIESDAITVEVKDPVDNDKILDVWHEVTYARPVDDLATAVDEVKWSLALEKYISG